MMGMIYRAVVARALLWLLSAVDGRAGPARRKPGRTAARCSGRRAPRHGGGAGEARRAHRRRGAQARRQRGRRRGRGRLRDGRDLSARRQHRRRRLHADPSRQPQPSSSRSTIARPRRPRPRRTPTSTRAASPIRRSRASSARRSACRARWRAWRWRTRNTARANSRWANLIAPAIALARDGIPVEDDLADSLPYAQPMFARWPASAKIFLRRDGKALAPRRPPGAERSRAHALRDRARRPARLLRGTDRREDRRRGARRRRR